jgi:hypothetical protein
VLEFFETSTRNLLEVEAAAGVRHHVALSVVGAERLPDSGDAVRRLAGPPGDGELTMAGDVTKDGDIQRRISELVDEEHALERGLALPLEEHRIDAIGAELDQCCDLLRQRHARLAAGLDVDGARVRPSSVVGSYLQ